MNPYYSKQTANQEENKMKTKMTDHKGRKWTNQSKTGPNKA